MILAASKHSWAVAFCPHCEKIIHYQLEDVQKVLGSKHSPLDPAHSFVPVSRFIVTCKCDKPILVGERGGHDADGGADREAASG